MAKNVIFNMAAAAILDFVKYQFSIWCKYMQKWWTYGQKCDFEYGGLRHLGFR